MKITHIRQKLSELGYPVESLSLGDFDVIGEYTAKKSRSPSSPLYRTSGCFFRPNYERGLLIYSLIRHFKVRSYVEIGFGRGYSAVCAAKALEDEGMPSDAKVLTIDPNLDKQQLQNLTRVLPAAYLNRIEFFPGKSEEAIPRLIGDFDMVYIDGDHTYEAVKRDWLMCKDRWQKVILFDDYHLPGKVQKDIECARVIDEIDDPTKELIVMDRQIFQDDRNLKDDEIDYGQVLMTR